VESESDRVLHKSIVIIMIVLAFAAGSLLSAQSQDAYPPSDEQQQPYQQPPPQPYSQQQPESQQPYQQQPPEPQYGPAQQGQTFSADELRNLVAPIALYPDALLSQVLVASTYPQEVADAADWMQQNRFLRGRELMTAAQQQNWDPSIQALVAFPDVLTRLSADVQWLTDLGNAFLAQQADVMNAVQDLRAEARGAGMLRSSPRFQVNTETQGARTVIEIAPANPQIIYVPSYDPYAVWGPPVYGAYPAVPCVAGSVFGAVVTAVADIASLLPGFGGWLGPRSWGWALGWLGNALFVNNGFFHSFGFHWGGRTGGTAVWVHDWHHRLGVPYGRDSLAYWHRGTGPGHAGWHNFAARNEGGRTFGGYRANGRESFDRGRDNSWRSFNNHDERARAGYANSNTARSFAPSRSYESRPSGGGFAHFPATRSAAPSRSITATRSWSEPRSFSSTSPRATAPNERGNHSARSSSGRSFNERSYSARSYSPRSSFEQSSRRESSRSFRQSSRKSSGSQRSSSHTPKAAHYSAPRMPKAPKMAKAHGGGHSSRGHSGSKSHRG
jgi:hypothetical protein